MHKNKREVQDKVKLPENLHSETCCYRCKLFPATVTMIFETRFAMTTMYDETTKNDSKLPKKLHHETYHYG